MLVFYCINIVVPAGAGVKETAPHGENVTKFRRNLITAASFFFMVRLCAPVCSKAHVKAQYRTYRESQERMKNKLVVNWIPKSQNANKQLFLGLYHDLVKKKYENKSRNQPLIIPRNEARLSFDCIKTIIGNGQAGREKNSMKPLFLENLEF